jgi:hypothetical protein
MKKGISFFILLFFYACHQAEPSGKETDIYNDSVVRRDSKKGYIDTLPSLQTDTSIKRELEPFFDIPHDIDGCSGLFINAVCELNCPYLLVTDLQGKAYVKIDDRLVRCELVRKSNEGKRIYEIFKAGLILIILEAVQYEQVGDEVWEYRGTIKLKTGEIETVTNVKGKVGC